MLRKEQNKDSTSTSSISNEIRSNLKSAAVIFDIDGTLAINDGSRSYWDYDENVLKDKDNINEYKDLIEFLERK